MGILLGVGHVVHRAGAYIHFPHEVALDEDGERTVDGGSRNRAVDFSRFVQELFSGKVSRLLEDRFEDRHALAGHAQVVLYQVALEFFSAVLDRHSHESQDVLNSCQLRMY